jgi:hypothetical protein
MVVAGLVLAPSARAGVTIGSIPLIDADDNTPRVVDDATQPDAGVYKLLQVGSTMYAGGRFRTVLSADRATTYSRRNLFSFNAATGVVRSWAPRAGGHVWALTASHNGRYLYIGGTMGSFDGVKVNRLVKYDLQNRRVDTTFRFPMQVGKVSDLQLVGGRLFVAGTWEGGLVAVDPRTGAVTSYFNHTQVSGGNTQWSTRAYRFAVNPAQTRMVIIGSFTHVGTQSRAEAAMLNLGATSATVSAWHSPRWDQTCNGSRWYTRDVDWTPDGAGFVIDGSGGNQPTGSTLLCDSVSMWRPVDADGQQPVWVNESGGGTFYSVAATNRAIFVGGHFLWLNNELGDDAAGSGSVNAHGLGAVDPTTGRALSWNPWKTTVGGLGAYDLYFTDRGLWVGHFEPYLGTGPNGHELHEGLGLLPFSCQGSKCPHVATAYGATLSRGKHHRCRVKTHAFLDAAGDGLWADPHQRTFITRVDGRVRRRMTLTAGEDGRTRFHLHAHTGRRTVTVRTRHGQLLDRMHVRTGRC